MATVDTLLVKIQADTKDVRRELAKIQAQTQMTTNKMGASFAKMGFMFKAVVGAVIVRQAARAGGAFLNAAADAQEMQSKSSVVFGAFAADFRQFTGKLGEATGRSKFELEEMGASVQDLFVPLGFARSEATELSKKLTTLAVDVASFNNATDVDTMNAFKSALIGNHESVQRFGVVINEVTLQQELFAMGIRKSRNEITPQEKALARLNLILKGTTDAHGDAIRTAMSYRNSQKRLQGAFHELKVEIGKLLTGPAAGFTRWLVDVIKGLKDMFIAMGLIDATNMDEAIRRFKKQVEASNEAIKKQNALIVEGLKNQGQQGANYEELVKKLQKVKGELNSYGDGHKEVVKILKDAGMEHAYAFVIPMLKEIRTEQKNILKNEAAIAKAKEHWIKIEEKVKKLREIAEKAESKKKKVEVDVKAAEERAKKLKEIKEELELIRDTALVNLESAKISDFALKTSIRMREHHHALVAQGLKLGTKEYNAMLKLRLETDSHNQAIKNMTDARAENARKAKEDAEARTKAARDAAKAEIDSIKKWTDTIREARPESVKYQEQIDALVAAKKKWGHEIPDITEKLNQLKEMQFKSTEAGRLWMTATESLSSSISRGIADIITQSGEGLRNWKDSLKSILNQVIQQLIKTRIQAILTGLAIRAMGSGSFFGGSAPKTGNSAVNTAYKPPTMTAASGGNIRARVPTLVGERGPELFMPNTGGTMKNAHDTRSMAGGGETVINQSFNISAGVAQTVRAEIMSMMPMIQTQTLGAVVDAKRRGGAFADAMA